MKILIRWYRRIRYRMARRWALRKMDRVGMPRSESEKIVGFILGDEP